MTRKNTRALALIALLTIGAGASIVNAAGPYRGHYGHRQVNAYRCDARIAGYLTIDGCRTTISSGRGLNAQVVRAFRKAGYRAWIEGGCVRVDYGHCKPCVRWRTEDYAAQLRWSWGDLHVSLREVHRYAHRPLRVSRSYRPYGHRTICR